MKKYLFLLLFIPLMSFSQQFSFPELIKMIEDKSYYERKNISFGNDITESRSEYIYSYKTSSGNEGSSRKYPTLEDNDRFIRLSRFKNVDVGFAQNYNKDLDTAYNFYKLRIKGEEEIIVSDGSPRMPNDNESRQLNVFVVNESEYNKLVKTINSLADYLGIEKYKYVDGFKIKYKYEKYLINIEDDNREDVGGRIKIYLGDWYIN